MRTKQTVRGNSNSHQPRGMATARFTGSTEAEEQQFADASGEDTKDSQTWPDIENAKAAKQEEGETSMSRRLRKEQKHLPKKIPQHPCPPTRN